jgi:hypothetical protein
MRALRGFLLASGLFAGAFVLHIVAGALDLDWLFALAVALIFASAALFPLVALVLAGRPSGGARRVLLLAGCVAGIGLTAAALWAANGRAIDWWTVPLAFALVLAPCLAVLRFLPSAAAGRNGLAEPIR